MRIALACLIAGLLATLSACKFHPAPMALQPVGPAPFERTAPYGKGQLIVYSAWDPVFNRYNVNHTPYTVAANDGKFVERIKNHLGPLDDDPTRVPLAAGSYTVTAQSQDYGMVVVPVAIETGRTTVLYLDGWTQPHPSAADKTKLVRLPDGQFVGWAASATEKSQPSLTPF
jgi:hypothetical protein